MIIKVKAKALSSLTVGGNTSIGSVDVAFNELGIPGSSIKGAMRTAISKAIMEGEIKGYTSCGEIEPKKMKECDVCRVFGSPEHEGIVNVHGVKLSPQAVLTRVAIDDRTMKAMEKALFKQEVIKPNTEFEFTVEIKDGASCSDIKLILLSLFYLRLWRLGRGGMIDIKVDEFPQGCDFSELDELRRWLW